MPEEEGGQGDAKSGKQLWKTHKDAFETYGKRLATQHYLRF